MLGPGHLGRVESAVDVDDRAPLARQLARGLVAEAATVGEPLRDLLVAVEPRQVLGRREDRDLPVEDRAWSCRP